MRLASERSNTPPETSLEISHSTNKPGTPGATGRSQIVKSGLPRGSGFITRTMVG